MSNWNQETTQELSDMVTSDVVSREQLIELSEHFDVSTRSIQSKLRYMGISVEPKTAAKVEWTEDQVEELVTLLDEQPNTYTYKELAAQLDNGFDARQVQGKVLSLKMYDAVKPTEKTAYQSDYTDEQTETLIQMASEGAFMESIAEAVGKPLNSVRGKALSLLRSGSIDSIPLQENTKPSNGKVSILSGVVGIENKTVEQLAEELNKTPRGIKTSLAKQRLSCADYTPKVLKQTKKAA